MDLDIDRILESPKLRLQLSPAELDKQLLELYKNVADGPSGDVLRVIGGGQDVAFQDLYIKKKTLRERSKNSQYFGNVSFGPFEALGEDSDEEKRTASEWVNFVLRRNLPKTEVKVTHQGDRAGKKDKADEMNMMFQSGCHRRFTCISPRPTSFKDSFCIGRSRVSSYSLLI